MGICLVTGVAGFIGSHLAERLVREGYMVIGVDAFTPFYAREIKQRNLAGLLRENRFRLIEGDLNCLNLKELMRDLSIEYVFHLAAQPGVRTSWGDRFEEYLWHNVRATQRLLEAAKELPLKKFIYASSSSIYGDSERLPISEESLPRPISPYGVTKLAGEHLCLLYERGYGVPAIVLRYFTVYGPRQRPDMAFYRFIRAALEGKEIPIYGDGEQTRDFTFVDDAVEGTLRGAWLGEPGQVFNIGGGAPVRLNSVLQELEEMLGIPIRVRYRKTETGDVLHTFADIRRAQRQLGYIPQVSLREGLARQVEWFLKEHRRIIGS